MGDDSDGIDEAIRKSGVRLLTLDYNAWFPISDALLLVANEISPKKFDKKALGAAPQVELFRSAKKELISILEGGEVTARVEVQNGFSHLDPIRFGHFAFCISFASDEVLLDGIPTLKFFCEVNRVELEAFLNGARKERATLTSTQIKWEKCRAWLEELTLRPKDRTKSDCKLYAEAEFGVSKNAFDKIWSATTADPGRRHWTLPGRPSVENPWKNPTPSD